MAAHQLAERTVARPTKLSSTLLDGSAAPQFFRRYLSVSDGTIRRGSALGLLRVNGEFQEVDQLPGTLRG